MKLLFLIQLLLLSIPTFACNEDLKTREDFKRCREKIEADLAEEAIHFVANKAKAEFVKKNLEGTKKQIDALDEEYEKELDQYFEDHLDLNPKSEEFQNGIDYIRSEMIEKRNALKQKHLLDVSRFEFKSK